MKIGFTRMPSGYAETRRSGPLKFTIPIRPLHDVEAIIGPEARTLSRRESVSGRTCPTNAGRTKVNAKYPIAAIMSG